jgi:hypothetical protein
MLEEMPRLFDACSSSICIIQAGTKLGQACQGAPQCKKLYASGCNRKNPYVPPEPLQFSPTLQHEVSVHTLELGDAS